MERSDVKDSRTSLATTSRYLSVRKLAGSLVYF